MTADRPPSERRRQTILQQVAAYYADAFPARAFVPGETPVPVSGRVFDQEDLVHLVDASLDFWLTTGRYAEQFERERLRPILYEEAF